MTHLLLSRVKWEVLLAVGHAIPSGLSIRPFFLFFSRRRKLTCHAQARKSPCIKDPSPFTLASAVKSLWYAEIFPVHSPDGYAMLMSPNKGETAVRGCHCQGNTVARMRELLVRLWVGVCVPLALGWLDLFFWGWYLPVWALPTSAWWKIWKKGYHSCII